MKQRESFLYYRLVWLVLMLAFVPLITQTSRYLLMFALIPSVALMAWQVLAIKYLMRNPSMAPWDWAILLLNVVCLIGFWVRPAI